MASSLLAPATVEYPSSDGRPMAESDFRLTPLTYAREALRHHFRHRRDVYVSGNLLISLTGRGLRFHHPASGQDLPDLAETDAARQRAEQERREAEARLAEEAAARQAAEARVEELEALLRQSGDGRPSGT